MGQLTHLSRLNSAAALGDGAASRCHRAGRRGITPGIRAAVPGCLGAYPAAPRFHARGAGHPAQAGGAAILKHPGLSPPVLALTAAGDARSVTWVSLDSIFVIQCSQTTILVRRDCACQLPLLFKEERGILTRNVLRALKRVAGKLRWWDGIFCRRVALRWMRLKRRFVRSRIIPCLMRARGLA